jgi:hypothetical protein
MKTVKLSELETLRMVTGNEKKYSKVIVDGQVKEWVGIGWIDIDDEPDEKLYPVVVDCA